MGAIFIIFINVLVTSVIFAVLYGVFRFFLKMNPDSVLRYDEATLLEADEAICSERLYVQVLPEPRHEPAQDANGSAQGEMRAESQPDGGRHV